MQNSMVRCDEYCMHVPEMRTLIKNTPLDDDTLICDSRKSKVVSFILHLLSGVHQIPVCELIGFLTFSPLPSRSVMPSGGEGYLAQINKKIKPH